MLLVWAYSTDCSEKYMAPDGVQLGFFWSPALKMLLGPKRKQKVLKKIQEDFKSTIIQFKNDPYHKNPF